MAESRKKFLYVIGTKGAKKAAGQMGKLDKATDRMRITTGGLQRRVGALRNKLLLLAFAAGGAALALSFGKLAAEVENVERAFNKLAGSEKLLTQMQKSLKGTISELEIMRQAIIGIDLGATNEQIRIFAEFARLEGVRKGSDVLTVFQNILGGVLRGSTELLDNFGISLTKLNKTIDRLAVEQFGKLASGLSAVERRELSVIAATEIMNDRLTLAGDIAVTDADKYAQAVAGLQNVKAAIGELISPATILLINNFVNGYEVLLRMLGKDSESEIQKSANAVFELQKAIKNIQVGNIAWLNIVRELNIEMDLNATLADKLAILYDAEAAALTRLMDLRLEDQTKMLTEWAGAMEEVAAASIFATRDLEKVEAQTKRLGGTFQALDTTQQLLIDNVETLTDGLIQATLFGQKFGDAIVSSLKAIAAELIKQAAVFLLMNLFTGGTASLTGARGFFNFAATGNFIPPAPSINSGGGNQGPAVINQNTFLIINDEQATELQSILNRAQFNA